MQSPAFVIDFTVDPTADVEAVRQAIQSRLAAIPDIGVETRREEPRFTGAELAEVGALIAASVVIVRGSRELLIELIKTVREVVRELRLKAAVVDTGLERLPVDEVTEEKLRPRVEP